jgi:hypothetical protein
MRPSYKTVAAEFKAKGYRFNHGPSSIMSWIANKGWNSIPFNNLFEALIFARELPAIHTTGV